MGKILLCSRADYPASKQIYATLGRRFKERVVWVGTREELASLLATDIEWIIFSFWSWVIPNQVLEKYKCISFHTGDLPKDRGGSPIQNLIMAGRKTTMLTAFKTSKEMDGGPVYLKSPLDLTGDLLDIHKRMVRLIPRMVSQIIRGGVVPKPQKGEPNYWKRRTPEQSEISPSKMTGREIYDLVRCLNMDPYPPAFIRGNDGKKVFILKARFEE